MMQPDEFEKRSLLDDNVHPIMISAFYNSAMGRYDLDINIGNFSTLADASAVAEKLKDVFVKELKPGIEPKIIEE